MSAVGIVAEYNPFHLGHQYHILRTREIAGEGASVVCVLSGDFVQRGEAACFSKFARAEAACRCGADLVVELPLPWCLSSAENYARGAVYLLDALGCDIISFGSESGDLDALLALADLLSQTEINDEIKNVLLSQTNMSYAAARQLTLQGYCGKQADLLEKPNNILAVEYLKAIKELHAGLKPVSIRRYGSEHDGSGGVYCSASELRNLLRTGGSIYDKIPPEAEQVLRRETELGLDISRLDMLETAILSRLRTLPLEAYERLPDASNGLGRKLCRAAHEEPSLIAVMEEVKSKRYAMSRVRRMICCAALGVDAEITQGLPPYARVLAANDRGCEILSRLRGSTLPVVAKPAAVRELDEHALRIFTLGADAHDLLVLGRPNAEARRGGGDWRTSPQIL